MCTFTVTGKVRSPEDGYELQCRANQVSIQHECRFFLIDMRQAEIITKTMPAFETAKVKDEFRQELRKHKTAVLYSRLAEHERFFETVAVNSGFTLKVFDRYDEAVEWLAKDCISVNSV